MKIAMLTNNYKPFVGGVPISVERQAKELAKLGHEVTVFAPDYGEEDAEAHKDENAEMGLKTREDVRVIRFGIGKRCMENGMVYPRLILKEIVQVFEEESFDLVHTHHPMFVGPTALYLGRKYHLPVIYTYHTRYEDYLHYLDFLQETKRFPAIRRGILKFGKTKVVPKYMRWFTNHCDLVLAPTAGMQKRIRENGTEVPIAVFPTGLKEEFYLEYPEETKAIRKQYLPNGGYLFCTTGRLEEEKNPRFLLAGIAGLKKRLQDEFQVLLIGNGSMRDILEEEAGRMGISDVIHFLGNVPNEKVNRYLQASDAFLFASKSETQGIVLAEAFAAGCPVAAVKASGVEDIVEDGINGFQTEENIEDWVDKVLKILESGEEMRERAKVTASGYRASRLAFYEELLYRQCVAEKQRGREETEYGYEENRSKRASERVFSIFKTS